MPRLPFRRRDEDFSDEIRAHLNLEADRLIAEGMTPAAARAAARRAFGNVALSEERFHDASRWVWLEQLVQDLRYAWRGMRHSPAFVATTVLTLAVGLGLLTVAFTILNTYVLRPFAVRDPYGLHQIGWRANDGNGQGFGWRDVDELGRRTELFSDVIGEYTRVAASRERPVMVAIVTPNYFEALGPAMALGRGLGRIDAADTGNPAVLSHEAWIRLFDRDLLVLGRDLDVNGRPFTIVGVLGPAFTGLGDLPRDVFVPISPEWNPRRAPGTRPARETEITVRLRPGVSAAAAESALVPFLVESVGKQDGLRAVVEPRPSPNALSLEVVAILSPVFAAFALVLVTACANVSNVMLARAMARSREMAVRLSIGASRGRVVRQLLTEGLLLSLLGGVAGLGLAAAGLQLATALFFSTLPASVAPLIRLSPIRFDARVFLFALAVSASATLLFALLPALQASRISLTGALRGHAGARRGSRLRTALVIGQVALALVLVIVAVTLARNGTAVAALDIGFATEGVLSVNVRGERNELAGPLAEALAADARVSSVVVTSGNPLFTQGTVVAAAPAPGAAVTPTPCTFVSPEFFSMLRIPVTHGRLFRDDEARAAAPVAIVSAATARALWPGQDAIGRTISFERLNGRAVDDVSRYPAVTVIGVAGDIVSGFMIAGRDSGHIYLPIAPADRQASAVLLRGRGDGAVGAAAIQEIIRRTFPDPEVFEVLPLGDMRTLQAYPLQAAAWVGALVGAIALVLSVSGLYGVLTYVLSQRRKEIGIRMALGATAHAVVGSIVRQSTIYAGLGAAIGLVLTFTVMKLLGSVIRLQTITLVDAAAFAAGIAMVFVATLMAAWQPARRAARVDPCQTLRIDG